MTDALHVRKSRAVLHRELQRIEGDVISREVANVCEWYRIKLWRTQAKVYTLSRENAELREKLAKRRSIKEMLIG